MTKLEAQYKDLQKALKRLKEAVQLTPTIIHQDATIQRFEFTFELSWKLMQTVLRDNGIQAYGPKNVIREAEKLELIDDIGAWFDFLKHRNITVHMYKESIARIVYVAAKEFVSEVEKLLNAVEGHCK